MAMHEVFHTLRLVYIIFRSCYVVEDALPIPIYLDTISLTEIYSCKEIRSSTFFFLELFLARHELLLKRDTLRKKIYVSKKKSLDTWLVRNLRDMIDDGSNFDYSAILDAAPRVAFTYPRFTEEAVATIFSFPFPERCTPQTLIL